MRPLELTLAGFRSHEKETTFSFEDRRFVAIVGPTGSGKSSILDGICYALYGKTPRVKTGHKRLICTRRDSAHVRFRFLVDVDPYEIVRALPRSGSGEHVLTDVGSGETTRGAEAVTQAVTEMLGLDFDAFCSSVLLAQNKFSEFLEAATTRRSQILKGVFRLEQIDDLRASAKGKAGELDLSLAAIDGELRGIPDDAEEQLKAERERLENETERQKVLGRALPEEKDLEELLAAARSGRDEALARLEATEGALKRVPVRDAVQSLVEAESVVLEKLDFQEKRNEELTAEHQARLKALSALEKKQGSARELVTGRGKADEAAALSVEMQEDETDRAARRTKLEELRTKSTDADAVVVAAEGALSKLKEERRRIEDAHRAHVLRGTLARGAPCPVCEQVVATVPKRKSPAALLSIDKKEKTAQIALATATEKAAAVVHAVSVEQAHLDSSTKSIEKARAKLKVIGAALIQLVGAVRDPVVEIDERLERLSEAADAVEEVSRTRDEARASLEACRTAEREFSTRRRRVAAALIELAGAAALEPPDVDASAETLLVQADQTLSALHTAREDAAASLEKANLHTTEIVTSLEQLRHRLDIAPGGSIADARAQARADVAVARKTVVDLEAKISRAQELLSQQKTLVTRKDLFVQLADDLRDNQFLNYLLEDRRRLLSDLGSERLRAMTGRYRFDDDANFDVVDELDGDKLREVQTLSGGETFLASLALALGLAEAVSRHGGRLQCFFMDEGFGSLDPESLDLALDGIENIVHPDRFIGLVSHVPGVALRVEDKIELEKNPDGMTVVKSGSSSLPA